MSLPDFSVRRPVTILVTTVALLIFGYLSWSNIPIELLPDLSYPTLTVQTEYADAAPTSVEQFITRPLEEAVGVISGVREMRSVSRAGLSEIVLEFEWDERMEFAAMEVREKLGLVELPREAERPRVLRFDPTLDPIVRLAFTGDRPPVDLRQIADRWLKPRLEAIQGVAAAKVRGGLEPEIQVQADEDRLAALGLTLDDLAQALRAENVNRPGGRLKDWGAVYLVRTLHEFTDLDQLRRTVVRESPAGRVRVEDVAQVFRGHRDPQEITYNGGARTVEIALHRDGSSNTIAVSRAIRQALSGPTGLRAQLSDDLELTYLSDQSIYIVEAIGQVWSAALIGGLLAILVLYFFLRDVRATVIIGLSIPISVVVTFLPMYKSGVTLNIMSLGGLALGVGMLVDNSIVVLEAIDRKRREGSVGKDAATEGARNVVGAVTAATLTTVSVFLPIVFVRGVAGQLFYDLAVTVCLALVMSLFVSLTLIPMLSAFELGRVRRTSLEQAFGATSGDSPWRTIGQLLRIPRARPAAGRLGRALRGSAVALRFLLRLVVSLPLYLIAVIVRGLARLVVAAIVWSWSVVSRLIDWLFLPATWLFDGIGRAYPRGLAGALRARRGVLAAGFAAFVLAAAAVPLLGTNLVPDLSQGEFAFRIRLPEGTPLEASAETIERIERRCLDDGRFERVFSVVGNWPSTASGRQTVGENLAQINFVLPDGTPAQDEAAAIEEVRRVLAVFPRVEAELAHPSVLSVRPPLAVNLFSENLDDLDLAAVRVAEMIWTIAAVEDVATSSEPGNPEIRIELDRERAADLDVQAEPLSRSLQRQIGGEIVGQFRELEQRLDIRLRALEAWRDTAGEVEDLRYRLENGTSVPVSAFASVTLERGPAAIYRNGGARVATVTAKLDSTDLGRSMDELKTRLAGLELPESVVAESAGQDKELQVSFRSLRLALALAVFMVYVVMAVQFESLRHPFVILLSVPLGIIGVVLGLFLTDTSVSVLALIGAVMLAGIVVNNAIVLVDAINLLRREQGMAPYDAVIEAGRLRLRPILMTTLTTVLGLTPLALGIGAGAEIQAALARTVVGGLLASTLVTLVLIPVTYVTTTGLFETVRSTERAREPVPGGSPASVG
ncbi:MAG TPA: efflux RND transporter permease subunit [Candidatus Polarisedimenticolaceae bacterium]|nr:efflux RND transporter permease subunit [Candidatus Polarisedimenticolaceae bacterium]